MLAAQCDVVIVVGSPNSSNSNRLREVAAKLGADAYMIDRADQVRPEWIGAKRRIGVTAGASAPELLVQEVIAKLRALGATDVNELPGVVEKVAFPMPRGLNASAGDASLTPKSLRARPD
jgi:4-hydroxy-3-methylbut-2-enyl diphosphate reductase